MVQGGRVIGSGTSMASVLYRVISWFAPNFAVPTTRHLFSCAVPPGGEGQTLVVACPSNSTHPDSER